MIKDVMVHLDGTAADEPRIAAAEGIADAFHSHIIGLFLNVMPLLIVPEDGIGSIQSAELLEKARAAGNAVEDRLAERVINGLRQMKGARMEHDAGHPARQHIASQVRAVALDLAVHG